MKTIETIERTLPAYWASYLINGDASGLETGEREVIDQYLASEGLPMPVSCSDEAWFAWRNDATRLGGDVMEYVFLPR